MKARFTRISTGYRTFELDFFEDSEIYNMLLDMGMHHKPVSEQIEFLLNNYPHEFVLTNVYEQDEHLMDEEML